MPISPKPSDYVSQVRGFLNDLRQDAQQNAQLGLQYAQLAQQRNLALLQANLQREQYDRAYASKQLEAQNEQLKSILESGKQARTENLAERRFELDTKEFERREESDRQQRLAESESRYALQKLNDYIASNDSEGYNKWAQELAKTSFFNANIGKVLTEGLTLWNSADAVRKNNLALQSMPEYNSLLNDAQQLKVKLPYMSRDQREAAIADWENRSGSFKVKIPNEQMIAGLNQNSEAFKLVNKDIGGQETAKKIETFFLLGRNQQLKNAGSGFEEIQNKFNELYNSTPAAEQNTLDFQNKLNDLRLSYNLKRSEAFLASEANRLKPFEEAQLSRPELTLTDESGNVLPKLRAPDLSPNALIGNLNDDNEPSPLALKKIEDFVSRASQQGILIERVDPNKGLLALAEAIDNRKAGKTPSGQPVPPSGTPSAQVDKSRVKFSNPWAMPETTTAATPSSVQPATPTAATQPSQIPSANINNLEANRALFAEVQRQLREGKKYLEVINPQTGEIKLTQISLATLNSTLPGLIQNLEESAVVGGPPEERR